jgi:hypothetical protein
MKKLLFLPLLLITCFSFAQEIPKLKLTPTGVEAIVVNVDSLKADYLFKKAVNWVQETYKNPDKVLKTKIENEKIRVDGFANNAWWYKTLGMKMSYNMDYSIEVSFKDGKYRFEFVVGQFYTDGGQKFLANYSSFFKSSGEVKGVYSEAVPSLEETMNNLSLSFYNYVTGVKTKKDSNW